MLSQEVKNYRNGHFGGISLFIVGRLFLSLVPRPLPCFQCYTQKRERAWYLVACDWPATAQSMGRVGEGLCVGSVPPDCQCVHTFFLHMQTEDKA